MRTLSRKKCGKGIFMVMTQLSPLETALMPVSDFMSFLKTTPKSKANDDPYDDHLFNASRLFLMALPVLSVPPLRRGELPMLPPSLWDTEEILTAERLSQTVLVSGVRPTDEQRNLALLLCGTALAQLSDLGYKAYADGVRGWLETGQKVCPPTKKIEENIRKLAGETPIKGVGSHGQDQKLTL